MGNVLRRAKLMKLILLNIMLLGTTILKPNLEIKYLKDCPQYTETCAEWSFTTWGHHTPERTLADFVKSRQEYLNDDKLPLTIVAFYNNIPVGMCSLAANRGILPELTPWLATLYVTPEYRSQRIGKVLDQAICNKAKSMGFNNIYCFTSDPSLIPWYQENGWTIRCSSKMHDHAVTVLEKFI